MNAMHCPACGAILEGSEEKVLLRTGRGKNEWARCEACSAHFLSKEYNLAAEVGHTRGMAWGNAQLGQALNEFKSRMYKCIVALLVQYAPPPAFLVDVGCSYGGFLMEAQKAGYKVGGIDIVPEAVEYVNGLGIPCEVSSNIAEISMVGDAGLDIVSILDANCYWPNQIEELRHANAKLKPGGVLAMRVVDKSWMFALGVRLRKINERFGERLAWKAVNDHRFSMPFQSLLAVVRDLGFETLYARPKGALHSSGSSLAVKLAFAVGDVVWRRLGAFCAPGAVLIARKALK
jgi:SAM-dependent methyltransferase